MGPIEIAFLVLVAATALAIVARKELRLEA
jgi:hypothetical protein